MTKKISNLKLSELVREFVSVTIGFDCVVSDITLDSRKVRPGSIFIAYAGVNYDGRDFIAEAVANGAVVIIQEGALNSVTQKVFSAEKKITIISLDDIRSKIGIIAAKFYGNPTNEMSVVGITGTNGKTSCTQFIAKSLQALGQSCGVIGTLGMGLPDELVSTVNTTPDAVTLQSQFAKFKKQNVKTVAMEVSSHGLEQKRVEGINFKIAVFTNLTHEHLDSHHDMENYFAAKKKLFLWPNLQYAVINIDDPSGRRLLREVPSSVNSYAYSVTGQDLSLNIPTVKASDVNLDRNGFSAKIISPWGEGIVKSSLLGVFNLSNLLAVFTTLMLLGVEFEEALKSLSLLKPFAGRMQSYGGGKFPLIVVDYAHTPDALENALAALREHCHGKLWCVFGCGGDRDRGKRPIMGQIAERLSDNIIITDDNPRTEDPEQIVKDIVAGLLCPWAIEVEHDRRTAIMHAINNANPEDVILIAGKGHENYQIIGNEKIPFNDADVVLSCLGSF